MFRMLSGISLSTFLQASYVCGVGAVSIVEYRDYWNTDRAEPTPVRSHCVPIYTRILDFAVPGQVSTL